MSILVPPGTSLCSILIFSLILSLLCLAATLCGSFEVFTFLRLGGLIDSGSMWIGCIAAIRKIISLIAATEFFFSYEFASDNAPTLLNQNLPDITWGWRDGVMGSWIGVPINGMEELGFINVCGTGATFGLWIMGGVVVAMLIVLPLVNSISGYVGMGVLWKGSQNSGSFSICIIIVITSMWSCSVNDFSMSPSIMFLTHARTPIEERETEKERYKVTQQQRYGGGDSGVEESCRVLVLSERDKKVERE